MVDHRLLHQRNSAATQLYRVAGRPKPKLSNRASRSARAAAKLNRVIHAPSGLQEVAEEWFADALTSDNVGGMAEPEIRIAKPYELPSVLELYRQLNPGDPVLDLTAAEQVWSALLDSGFTTVFVADVGGMLVSSCTLALIPNLSRGARPYGVIENVVTDTRHRRGGIGRAVLQTAIDKAFEADCYKVHLATGSKREATLRFYEGVGFTRDAKTYFEIRRA